MVEHIPEYNNNNRRPSVVLRELDQIHASLKEINVKLDAVNLKAANFDPKDFVTQDQFKPMAKLFWFIVFSFAGIIVTAIGTLMIQSNTHVIPRIGSDHARTNLAKHEDAHGYMGDFGDTHYQFQYTYLLGHQQYLL